MKGSDTKRGTLRIPWPTGAPNQQATVTINVEHQDARIRERSWDMEVPASELPSGVDRGHGGPVVVVAIDPRTPSTNSARTGRCEEKGTGLQPPKDLFGR